MLAVSSYVVIFWGQVNICVGGLMRDERDSCVMNEGVWVREQASILPELCMLPNSSSIHRCWPLHCRCCVYCRGAITATPAIGSTSRPGLCIPLVRQLLDAAQKNGNVDLTVSVMFVTANAAIDLVWQTRHMMVCCSICYLSLTPLRRPPPIHTSISAELLQWTIEWCFHVQIFVQMLHVVTLRIRQ